MNKLFEQMNHLSVVVVGDVMLDNYLWGNVDRISPEAPVPVVSIERKEARLGGAANVALNCKALGAHVTLASIVGTDLAADSLISLCQNAGIDTSLVQKSRLRPTTNKTRVLSRNQQMLRIDEEDTQELATEEEHPFIDAVLKHLQREKPQILIFEDYNKGVLKQNVIKRITEHCNEIGIITAVDPKKKNFTAYKNVTLFKPNLKEIREGLNLNVETASLQELNEVHEQLRQLLHHKISFITLSEKGVFYHDGEESGIIPAHIRQIADVSGAGDTVIATASMVYALTQNTALMAAIANLAGGLVCEQVGVVAIDKAKLLEGCVSEISAAGEF